VLVVQSVSVKPESGLTVEVIDREKLRISAASGLKSQTSFTYLVSNGATSATGTVVVIPLAPVPTSQPPIADDDAATVRVGDLVTVHVMDNDISPSGLPISVDPTLQYSGTAAQGEAFVAQGTVRFKAGTNPGRFASFTPCGTAKETSTRPRSRFRCTDPTETPRRWPVR
jgi:hypothetical protein